MRSIRVERSMDAPIEAVFEAISDHGRYDRFRGITGAEVIRPGDAEPNGLGAVRRVSSGPIHFEEEITAFERPTRMDYLILKVNLPIRHEGGSIRLEPTDGGTHAVWTSTFEATVPGVGWLLERIGSATLGRGFAGALRESERLARA